MTTWQCVLGFAITAWHTTSLVAGTVGSFSAVRNLPGYIELQHHDDAVYNTVIVPGKKSDGIERRTASRILSEDYLRTDGTIATDAIDAKILAIKKHENIAFLTYCGRKLPTQATHVQWCKSHSDTTIRKKWRKKKLVLAYKFAITQLQQAKALATTVNAANINQPHSQAFLEHLLQGLETFASINEQDPGNADLLSILRYAPHYMSHLRLSNPNEAANLVIPPALQKKYPQLRQQVFFAPRQLQELADNGELDIAALDPHDSGFWRKPHAIRNFDTRNYNGMSGFPPAITDRQQEIAVTLDWGGKFTGLTPKMRVRYGGWQWKMKYLSAAAKVQHATNVANLVGYWKQTASEVNTETVVNNLAAALGFTVDPTFFKASVRLYFPLADPTDAAEFERARQRLMQTQRKWASRPQQALADVNTDPRGHWYIRMRSVALERRAHADSDVSVGSYIQGAFSRPLKREFRAFALFSAWVANTDTKDDNANLVLVGDREQGYKVVFSAADMGSTLGSIFGKDAPNFLARDLVERVRRKPDGTIYEIVLNYHRNAGNRAQSMISINDVKWMTRLIAQLSPVQIKNAFRAAGYSAMLSEYFTQIMLRRRDQLLETFGLLGQTIIDAVGNRIVLQRESKMTDPDNYAVEGYEQFFRNGYLHDPQGQVSNNPSDFIRRYYDRDIKHATRGTLQQALWETLHALWQVNALSTLSHSLQKLPVTNRTFGLPLLDGNFCKQECFYDGLRVGLTNFLPTRVLLKNPMDKDRPLLVADVYRFGFLLGADIGKDFPARFGIDTELNDSMPQARYQRIYEFIKVRPIDSVADSMKNLSKIAPQQIIQHRNINAQMIDNLQAGEVLIVSTYISRVLELRLGSYSILSRPLLSTGFDLERITVNRKALFRKDDGGYWLQFADLRATKFALGVEGEFLLQDFPVARLEIEKLSKTDLLYEFNNKQRHLIEQNIVRTAPSESIADMASMHRVIENSKTKLSRLLSIAKFFLNEMDVSSIIATNREQRYELHMATINDSRRERTTLPLLQTANTTLRSFVTADEQVFVKLNMHYDSFLTKRKQFAWVYKNMLPLLGKQFILFTPAEVQYYLDVFAFRGQVYILPEGVRNIMSQHNLSRQNFCVRYASAAGKTHPRVWCNKLFNNELSISSGRGRIMMAAERRFRNFRARYVKTVRTWQQPVTAEKRNTQLRAKAHAIAQLFAAENFKPAIWRMLQAMAGEENIYRDAVLTSRTGAFPAQSKEIRMPAALRGGAEATTSQTFADIVQAVTIFSDPLFGELQKVFYAPMGEDIVPALHD